MGMGEPLLNFEPVIESAKIMKEQLAYGLSRKRITISTSGITPQIDKINSLRPRNLYRILVKVWAWNN